MAPRLRTGQPFIDHHFIELIPSSTVPQMLATFLALNSKRLYRSSGKEE